MRIAGRKTKCNPKSRARILRALKDGHTCIDAARAGGMSEDTYQNWINKSKIEIALFEDHQDEWEAEHGQKQPDWFAEEVDDAKSYASRSAMNTLKRAAKPHKVLTKTTKTDDEGKTETTEVERWEFDWKADLEWLKAMRNSVWGARAQMDVTTGGQPLKALIQVDIDKV